MIDINSAETQEVRPQGQRQVDDKPAAGDSKVLDKSVSSSMLYSFECIIALMLLTDFGPNLAEFL